MVVLVIIGVLVSVYLARRIGRPKATLTLQSGRAYHPDRAHFQRIPGRRPHRRRRF